MKLLWQLNGVHFLSLNYLSYATEFEFFYKTKKFFFLSFLFFIAFFFLILPFLLFALSLSLRTIASSKLAIPPELHLIRIDSNWFESIQLELRFLRFFEYSVQLELEKSKFIFIWIVIFLGKYSWKFTWIFISGFMNIHWEYSRIFGWIRVKFDKIFAKLGYF